MNIYSMAIGTGIRALLLIVGAQNVGSDDEVTHLASGLVMVGTILWSLWQKYRAARAAEGY